MMKKFLSLVVASALLLCAACACDSKKDEPMPYASSDSAQLEYSVKITSEDIDGVPSSEVVYEYKDGKDSIEVYYISFGCDVDGLTVERIDENGAPLELLYSTESIKTDECFKLTTTVPEGFPNTQITVICGENEYRYQLAYNGRDGGAELIAQN